MSESVSDVLDARRPTGRGFRSAIAGSLAVHVGAVVAVLFFEQYAQAHQPPKPKLMTISLGGNSNTPKAPGMTSAGARPVEEVKPPPKRPEPVAPASTRSNVMALPVKSEPKPPKREETPQPLPVSPMPKPANTGAEITQGTSRVDVGAKGTDTGLTVGGKGRSSATLEVPLEPYLVDYLNQVLGRIEDVWQSNAPERGQVVLKFAVHRDGRVEILGTDSATSILLENRSKAALRDARLPPLPSQLKDEQLVIHLTFPYGR